MNKYLTREDIESCEKPWVPPCSFAENAVASDIRLKFTSSSPVPEIMSSSIPTADSFEVGLWALLLLI